MRPSVRHAWIGEPDTRLAIGGRGLGVWTPVSFFTTMLRSCGCKSRRSMTVLVGHDLHRGEIEAGKDEVLLLHRADELRRHILNDLLDIREDRLSPSSPACRTVISSSGTSPLGEAA
jgi:hypothetical protein